MIGGAHSPGSLCGIHCVYHFLLHKPCLYSASSARQELQLLPLATEENSTSQTMYKCLNSVAPPYLTRFFETRSTHHNTCINHKATEPPCDSSLLWPKKPSAVQVLWCGDLYPAMFKCAKTFVFFSNCAVHDLFSLL